MNEVNLVVYPIIWKFNDKTSKYCCQKFRGATFGDDNGDNKIIEVDSHGTGILFEGRYISYCPYCGSKLYIRETVT